VLPTDRVFCSIDKIDLAARIDGKSAALQRDDRSAAEIAETPELSVLFALARVINTRAQLAEDGLRDAAVHYVMSDEPPAFLRDALAAAGARLELTGVEQLGPGSAYEVGLVADRAFKDLARRAANTVGVRDLAMALRMLEDQTKANPPSRSDELDYWTRVLELSALAGEVLRAKYPGRWVQSDRATAPFAFQLSAREQALMFPTNRAQRVVEGDPESLFKLLIAAEQTVSGETRGRLMPSLRDRRDVALEDIVWKPVISDDAPSDLPIVVCGIDGKTMFGLIRKDGAMPNPFAEAYANLSEEEVQCDEVAPGILVVSGSFYAAEKLLDREFMRSLHDVLGADLLAAATPARGCLLVGRITDNPAAIARFAELSHARYNDGRDRKISPAVMLVSDGRVAGYVRGPEDEPREDDTQPERRVGTTDEPDKKPGFLRRLFGRK
jgi:hypothetical protein